MESVLVYTITHYTGPTMSHDIRLLDSSYVDLHFSRAFSLDHETHFLFVKI